jgi:tRNA (guanine-N7-)-methyltransferase
MLSLLRHAQLRNITPAPPDWEKAFGRAAPIEVDLGCGRGDYAWQRAAGSPGIHVVALETRRKWITRLRRRCRREGVNNLRAIRCDATQDLPVLFARSTVRVFTVHHPDPWWKKRHRKRRMVRREVILQMAEILQTGGFVYLQTDVPDLAEEIRSVFSSCRAFEPVPAEQFRQDHLGGLQSHREKKCLELGIPIQRLAYTLAGPVEVPP